MLGPGRLLGYCKCASARFESTNWGKPAVEVTVSQDFTIITVKVPCKFRFTCQKTTPEGRCLAVVVPEIVKLDFPARSVVTSGIRGTPFHGGICDGKPKQDTTELGFVIVIGGRDPKIRGRMELRFGIPDCPGTLVWDMGLVIQNGKLDEGASDYDGDGTSNADEPGREWDPGR